MKPILILVTLIATAINVHATGKDSLTRIRNWSAPATFNTIIVNDDVDVMLIEDSSSVISVEGLTKFVDAIQLQVINGNLVISSTKQNINGRAFVFVPVHQLKSIVIKGISEVHSIGILQSPNLQVYIENICLVSIRNNGLVKVGNNENFELEYIKNSTTVAVKD
jgi:Putative auto-transporter adhesin, head GIN domain